MFDDRRGKFVAPRGKSLGSNEKFEPSHDRFNIPAGEFDALSAKCNFPDEKIVAAPGIFIIQKEKVEIRLHSILYPLKNFETKHKKVSS